VGEIDAANRAAAQPEEVGVQDGAQYEPPDANWVHPEQLAGEVMQLGDRRGMRQEDAQAMFIARAAGEALKGNPGFIYKPPPVTMIGQPVE
jgi:hypothetical protein